MMDDPDSYDWGLGALLPLKVVLRRLADQPCLAEKGIIPVHA
ncbi:hypothetical protein [Desulfobacter hydrogenophilus]|nr:hypothetical protein [Desulfobacter hydrogenophilus]